MKCDFCGRYNLEHGEFCNGCGAALNYEDPTEIDIQMKQQKAMMEYQQKINFEMKNVFRPIQRLNEQMLIRNFTERGK